MISKRKELDSPESLFQRVGYDGKTSIIAGTYLAIFVSRSYLSIFVENHLKQISLFGVL